MTSFSRSSAPPRPLIRLPAGSTSSAPSNDQSGRSADNEPVGMPSPAQTSSTSSEVGTAVQPMPSAAARSASARMVDVYKRQDHGRRGHVHRVGSLVPRPLQPFELDQEPLLRVDLARVGGLVRSDDPHQLLSLIHI